MKQPSAFNRFFKSITESAHQPTDTEDEKLRKSSLIVMSLPFATAGLIWGTLYFLYGLFIPGMIPFCYGVLSLVSFAYLRKSKRYKFYRFSQILLILILPFSLQLTLGGFIPSSAVIIWAVISPLSAMVFYDTKRSLGWFLAYCFLVVIAYFVNDLLPQYFDWNLTDEFINLVFIMNILAVSGLIYAIQYYFVGRQALLKKAIEEQADKLQELDQIKSRFFANISHEFRTPLTLILGLINKQIAEASPGTNQRDNEMIQRNANRLLQLINQLLDLSKLESGEVKLKAGKGDIAAFTRRIFGMFESMAEDKRISMNFNDVPFKKSSENEVLEIFFDDEKLQKIIVNLISNAVKFTPADGSIRVKVFQSDQFAKIVIANSGPGIAPDVLPYVFDRFYQANAETTREYEGTGIGLALVRELTELHHGSVSVESDSELTTFVVSLPVNADYLRDDEKSSQMVDINSTVEVPTNSDQTNLQKRTIKTDSIFSTGSGTDQLEVLVVEDNHDLRTYIKSILEKDYKVTEAVDGLDGLEKAVRQIPDLIVSDVMMPGMDGYDLCKQLKTNEKTNHIPVVLLTAKASRENRLEGLETGADDYLVKPFDEEELGIRIRNLIAIREQLQQKYQDGAWIKPAVAVNSVHEKFLAEVKEAIEQNIDNDQFSVDDLGAAIAMSRSQIHRKLKALTDMSATAFIRSYRLHKAADLLRQEAGSVTEIAYQVGFSSQTYFSSSFQELFGCSPSQYSQRHQS